MPRKCWSHPRNHPLRLPYHVVINVMLGGWPESWGGFPISGGFDAPSHMA